MEQHFTLPGDATPLTLDQSGIVLIAPGLSGEGTWHSVRATGEVRARTAERTELDKGLQESGIEDRDTLVIDAKTPSPSAGGGRGGIAKDEIVLRVPLKKDESAAIMYADENGHISFHFRTSRALASGARAAATNVDEFRIMLRRPQPRPATGESRGLIGKVVSKIFKVLIVKAFPSQVSGLIADRVKSWEEKHRAFRGFHEGDAQSLLGTAPTANADMRRYVGQRSLLFIHGTTSTTMGAFGALRGQPQLLEKLYRGYDNRVLGFNHHTMSESVTENMRQFYDALVPGDYSFDVICHSRGGLLARAVANPPTGAWQPPTGVRVRVDRIVFVATPNAGTQLAIPDQVAKFVERLANYVNMLPDSAASIAAGALMSIVASLAEVTLPRLPGLADQAPHSDLLRSLQAPAAAAGRYYAFQANYEAQGSLLDTIKDGVVDRIFESVENDLVVPTSGVSVNTAFSLPAARITAFGAEAGVHHTNFFSQAKIAQIADYLGVP